MDNPVVSKAEVKKVSRVWDLPLGTWVKVPLSVLASFVPHSHEDVVVLGGGLLSLSCLRSKDALWDRAQQNGYIVIGRLSSMSAYAGMYYVQNGTNVSIDEVKLSDSLQTRATPLWPIISLPPESVVRLYAGDLQQFMGGTEGGRWVAGGKFDLPAATVAIAELVYGQDHNRTIPVSAEVPWAAGSGVRRDTAIYLIRHADYSFSIELVDGNPSGNSPRARRYSQFYYSRGLLVQKRYNHGSAAVAQPINQESEKEIDNMALSTEDRTLIAKEIAAAMAAAAPAQSKGPSVVGSLVKKSAGGLLGAIGYMTWQPWKRMAGPVWQTTRYTFAVSTLVAALTVAYLKGPALFAPSKDEPKAETKAASAQVEKTYTAAEVAELLKSLGK